MLGFEHVTCRFGRYYKGVSGKNFGPKIQIFTMVRFLVYFCKNFDFIFHKWRSLDPSTGEALIHQRSQKTKWEGQKQVINYLSYLRKFFTEVPQQTLMHEHELRTPFFNVK